MRRVRRLIAGAVLAVLAGAILLAGMIWSYRTESAPGRADAALVLGAAVIGSEPSPVLEERLRHALSLYEEGRVGAIVVTGGHSPEDDLFEGEASARWLEARGVPEAAIVVEDRSRTTIQNLVFARPLMTERGIGTALLVSDPLHMRRATIVAEGEGVSVRPSPTPTTRYRSWRTQGPFLLREVWFLAQYLVAGV